MGFYGNITNVANTTFQFDKIYSNRLDMEAHCNSDGIMVGRYVLVEYEQSAGYPVIYVDASGYGYPSSKMDKDTRIEYGSEEGKFTTNEIGQNQSGKTVIFYRCSGADSSYAKFEEITTVTSENNYIKNFAIDEGQYAATTDKFTGFDSTVWVKTSDSTGDSISTHYVNIANLNSVVPTFDIAADAPTMTPIMPHYDADSTNVYYKLHMQQPFGFRIAKNEARSDAKTTYYKYDYNSTNGITKEIIEEDIPADIYYNKAGFEPYTRTYIEPNKNQEKNPDNYIKIAPTGTSGNTYSHSADTGDIQELSIQLPAIGNMMSDAWDIVHGSDRDDYRGDTKTKNGKEVRKDSLQGRLNALYELKPNQIPIKRTDKGVIVSTTINGGNQKEEVENILAEEPTVSFDTDDAWIRTEINSDKVTGDDTSGNCISIHHTFHGVTNTYTNADKNTSDNDKEQNTGENKGIGDTLKLYSSIVDKAGHVVGKNTETVTLPYGYKTITTNGLAKTEEGNEITDKDLNSSTGGTSSANNTQDILAINTVNKWIQTEVTNDKIEFAHEIHEIEEEPIEEDNLNKEENANKEHNLNIPDWSYDNAGHITAKQDHYYTLPFGFKTIAVKTNSISPGTPYSKEGDLVAKGTQDTLNLCSSNKWIKIDGGSFLQNVSIGHHIQGTTFAGTYYATDVTKDSSEGKNQIPSFGDTVNILNVTVDNAGHVTGFGANTIKIPQGSYESAQGVTEATEVITSISFDETEGKISSTKANTKTLKLTDYQKVASATNESISSDETINGAFGKLEYRLNNEIAKREEEDTALSNAIKKEIEDRDTAISTAISNLINGAPEAYDTFKEISDYINTHGTEAADMSTAIQKNTDAINNETTRADAEEKRIAALVGEISVSTQIDNKINALALGTASKKDIGYFATATQGDLAETAVQSSTEFNYGEDKKTIQDLMNIVKEQANTIADLTNRLNTLENTTE